jgi:hypothetical protein
MQSQHGSSTSSSEINKKIRWQPIMTAGTTHRNNNMLSVAARWAVLRFLIRPSTLMRVYTLPRLA